MLFKHTRWTICCLASFLCWGPGKVCCGLWILTYSLRIPTFWIIHWIYNWHTPSQPWSSLASLLFGSDVKVCHQNFYLFVSFEGSWDIGRLLLSVYSQSFGLMFFQSLFFKDKMVLWLLIKSFLWHLSTLVVYHLCKTNQSFVINVSFGRLEIQLSADTKNRTPHLK